MLEIILEMILLGTVDAAASRKVPMALRVLLAAILLAACLGLFFLLLLIGIQSGNTVLVVTAVAVLAASAYLSIPKIIKIRKGRENG